MRSMMGKIGIQVKITPRSRIWAAAVTGVLLVLIAIFCGAFFQPEVEMGGLQLFLSVLAALGTGLFLLCEPEPVGERGERIYRRMAEILFLLLPVATLCMVEFLHGTFIYDWSPLTFFQNYIFMLLVYLLCYGLSGKICWALIISNVAAYIFGFVNHYMLAFRGTPFLPVDVLSAKTGMTVLGTFDFTPDHHMILSTVLFLLLLVVAYRLKTKGENQYVVRTVRVAGILMTVVFSTLLFSTDWFASHGMKPDFFNQNRGYTNRGSMLQFVINSKYLKVDPPKDYSAEETDEIVDNMVISAVIPPVEGKELPNIICIMNESFSDLSVVGDFETNQDPLPFLHSMKENAVQGFVHVPVYGAGTANSEFEFLTGDSIAFLPMGSCAYDSYVKGPHPSLVAALGVLGYDRTAFHPYYGENWNRDEVYPYLGFDHFMDISTILGEEEVEQYRLDKDFNTYRNAVQQKYPDEQVFLRRYVSDAFDYHRVIDEYEKDRDGKPFFMFNVTMQNHSGYTYQGSDFTTDVYLTGDLEGKYPKVDQYLSVIHHADRAIEELLAYFEKVDEPTIICLFGDHQPSVEQEFYEEVYGKSLDELTIEEKERMFMTPFFIWANYDIEEEQIDAISANYLATLLMQVAELPMTSYQQYLYELHKTLPIINPVGYCDYMGNWYSVDDKLSPYAPLINDYRKVQYNHLLDRQNRVDKVFALENIQMLLPS